MEASSFQVKFKDEYYPAHYIKDAETARHVLSQLMEKDVLFGIDTETYAKPAYKYDKEAPLSPHLGQIRLIQVFDGRQALVFDLMFIGHEHAEMFIPFLETKRFIAHYAIFDLQFFYMLGIESMNIGCTHILAKLIFHATYPTDEGLQASLDALVKHVFKEDILKKVQASDWSNPNLTFEQVEYAALDALCVVKLAAKLATGMANLHLEESYQLAKDAQHPIAMMQLGGIHLNVDEHRKLIDIWRAELYEAKKEVLKITELSKLTSHTIAAWLESNLDKETLSLWPRTDKGKLNTDSNTLINFSYLPIVKPFSVFQKKEKLTSSFGTKLIGSINEATKRLHPRYNICGARTGRLSCSEPNIQQIPRDKTIRKNFIPKEGRVFVIADYSTIEVRVAAEMSNDENMLSVFERGLDIYKVTAANLNQKHIDKVTTEERQHCKALVLGLQYGLGAAKFGAYAKRNYGVEVDEEEAHESIKAYRKLFSTFRKWQLEQVDKVASNKFVAVAPFNRLRKLAADNAYGAALNHPIQSACASMMLCALINLNNTLSGYGRLVASIHDEIIVECTLDNVPYVKYLTEEAMKKAYYDVFPNGRATKNLVKAEHGASWGEAKG